MQPNDTLNVQQYDFADNEKFIKKTSDKIYDEFIKKAA